MLAVKTIETLSVEFHFCLCNSIVNPSNVKTLHRASNAHNQLENIAEFTRHEWNQRYLIIVFSVYSCCYRLFSGRFMVHYIIRIRGIFVTTSYCHSFCCELHCSIENRSRFSIEIYGKKRVEKREGKKNKHSFSKSEKML